MCVTILVLAGNSAQFQILHSYTLLLKSPVLMRSWYVCMCVLLCFYMKTIMFLPSCAREAEPACSQGVSMRKEAKRESVSTTEL